MSLSIQSAWRRAVLPASLLVLGGCAGTASTTSAMAPFSSDACSLFPDRAPIGQADLCDCCLAHDEAYWRGGSAAERLASDVAFERCVRTASGSPLLAGTMYGAVRIGGMPWLPSPFRWAYGWPDGRLYRCCRSRKTRRRSRCARRTRRALRRRCVRRRATGSLPPVRITWT